LRTGSSQEARNSFKFLLGGRYLGKPQQAAHNPFLISQRLPQLQALFMQRSGPLILVLCLSQKAQIVERSRDPLFLTQLSSWSSRARSYSP
jgi:hypothetical protein